ncbi:MAG: YcxB family protein [Pseudomonadota bacterium]
MTREATAQAGGTAISGSFTATYADFLALCEASQLWKARWRRARWPHWILTALVFCLGLFYLTSLGLGRVNVALGGLMVGGAIFLVLLEFILIPLVRRRAFKARGLAGRHVEFQTDHNGINIAQEAATSHVAWSGFERIDRFRHGTVLWLRGRQPFFIPDRAFDGTGADGKTHYNFAKEQIAGAQS